MGAWLALAAALAAQGNDPGPKKPTPLFSSDDPIHVTITGPINAMVVAPSASRPARPAVLTLNGSAPETQAIMLSPRGLTRRQKKACNFPPLRVDFTAEPAKTSLFDRQNRLKLVTHCRSADGHQQHVLLEYAAYRMLNEIHPTSLRARLGTFDYVEEKGGRSASKIGFFIEDPDDAARRNRLSEVRLNARIPANSLEPKAAARAAMFQYMIGNVDWSMRAGPATDICCHNFRLFGATAAARSGFIPVPYDFDASGLVNAPYAHPPESLGLSSVRERRYRGYCIHNSEALAAASEFRAKRAAVYAALAAVPQLEDGRRRAAAEYLDGFFRDIGTDDEVRRRLLKTCIS